ncbi:hypothetical protein AmDm5_1979 [Acetobacter malorum]|nr:hypothetical protein AmDm5_1979 [Acetobacter malorum]
MLPLFDKDNASGARQGYLCFEKGLKQKKPPQRAAFPHSKSAA